MGEKTYSKELAGLVKDYLKSNGYLFTFDKEKGIFQFSVGLNGRLKRVATFINVDHDAISFVTVSPIGADSNDEEMLSRMAVFLCRKNYELKNGSFQLDVRDGEIRYRVFVNCDKMVPSEEIINISCMLGPFMFESYGSAILSIIYAGASAEEAYRAGENGTDILARRLGIGKDNGDTIDP